MLNGKHGTWTLRDMLIHEHRWPLISWLTINPKRLNILRQADVYRAWHFTLLGVLPHSFPRPWNTNRNSNNIYQETRSLLRFSCSCICIAKIILLCIFDLFTRDSNDSVENKWNYEKFIIIHIKWFYVLLYCIDNIEETVQISENIL